MMTGVLMKYSDPPAEEILIKQFIPRTMPKSVYNNGLASRPPAQEHGPPPAWHYRQDLLEDMGVNAPPPEPGPQPPAPGPATVRLQFSVGPPAIPSYRFPGSCSGGSSCSTAPAAPAAVHQHVALRALIPAPPSWAAELLTQPLDSTQLPMDGWARPPPSLSAVTFGGGGFFDSRGGGPTTTTLALAGQQQLGWPSGAPMLATSGRVGAGAAGLGPEHLEGEEGGGVAGVKSLTNQGEYVEGPQGGAAPPTPATFRGNEGTATGRSLLSIIPVSTQGAEDLTELAGFPHLLRVVLKERKREEHKRLSTLAGISGGGATGAEVGYGGYGGGKQLSRVDEALLETRRIRGDLNKPVLRPPVGYKAPV